MRGNNLMKDNRAVEELRNELTGKWEKIVETLIYPKEDLYEEDYEEEDDGEYLSDEAFYENWGELISQTKDYFDTLPVKGSLSTEDLCLFETVGSFRYLPLALEQKDWTQELADACGKIWDLLGPMESVSKKTDTEKELDARWDAFLQDLFMVSTMELREFFRLFFDTYWYFKKREDTGVLNAGGWHILSSLSALKNVPRCFCPYGCRRNEFNAVRCLCEDLLSEINDGMPGFYTEDRFIILRRCVPPAGCSPTGAHMYDMDSFLYTYGYVVQRFDDQFVYERAEYYSERYDISSDGEEDDQ